MIWIDIWIDIFEYLVILIENLFCSAFFYSCESD